MGNILLEQDRTESRVETAETFSLCDLGETTEETVGEGRLRNKTDTGSLKRAQSNVSDELSSSGRCGVDGNTVVGSGLVAELVDALLLEELVSTELEGTLEEITGSGRTKTSQKSAGTFVLDDLADTTEKTAVVGDGVKLDTGLDAV
jgi:hypothetical protein